ncbi:MAG: hypothetical protein M3X11_06820 [Acidobacteriota bacterium]|nr:hypothetical protein [Acidobacteriota bacterium]
MQIVSRALAHEPVEIVPDQLESADSTPLKSRRTKMEMRGIMAVLSALMVGCLIPITMGIFPIWSGLNQFMILVGGVAGFFLFSGCLLLVYSDYLPKTETPKQPVRLTPFPKSVPTNQLPAADPASAVQSVTERTTDLLGTPVSKASREDAQPRGSML